MTKKTTNSIEQSRTHTARNPYQTIIVLGAEVRPEGIASEALRRRLTLAHQHFVKRPVPIICCGGKGKSEPIPEGRFMCQWLVEKGVPLRMTISENRSRNTDENIRFAKVLMQDRGLTSALIITSDYHIKRALAICKRYGVQAVGDGSASLPQYYIKNHVRELLAWIKFYLRL